MTTPTLREAAKKAVDTVRSQALGCSDWGHEHDNLCRKFTANAIANLEAALSAEAEKPKVEREEIWPYGWARESLENPEGSSTYYKPSAWRFYAERPIPVPKSEAEKLADQLDRMADLAEERDGVWSSTAGWEVTIRAAAKLLRERKP